MEKQLSLDEQAAQMAEKLLAKGGAAGDMPTGRKEAEGGFTSQIGGKVIDADAEKSVDADGMALGKSGKTGAAITDEPGRSGEEGKTGAKMSSEPGSESGGGPSGELDEEADEKTRQRKSKGKAPAGMSENEDASMRKRKAMSKAKKENEEEEYEEEEMMTKKSEVEQIDADALIKSLETLEAIAQGSTVPAPADRRAELGEKLAEGTLSKSEMRELADLMKAGTETEEALEKSEDVEEEVEKSEKSFQENWSEDKDLQEGYEVSNFLERHSQLTASALDQVQNNLSKSLGSHVDRVQVFNTQLAKSLMGMAQLAQRQESLIKSLADRLENVENTPLPRKSVGNVRALQKSMDGEVGGGSEIGRDEILSTLEKMAFKSDTAPCGEPLIRAVTLFEQTGKLSKSLYNDVIRYKESNSGTVQVH